MDNMNFQSSQQPTMAGPLPEITPPVAAPVAPGNTAIVNGAQVPVGNLATAKKKKVELVKTIVIIVLSLVAATFIGLFIWMYIMWDDASTDLNGQIKEAVAIAVDKRETEMENEFTEREKYPYKIFAGPADYGEISFEYPKTWSVYIERAATTGGDYVAYLNPGEVAPTNDKASIYALRLTIRTKSFDDVAAEYAKSVEKGELKVETAQVGGVTANRYTGTMPGTDFQGIVVILKIRDKTAVLRTDSTYFEQDFNTLLNTVEFNA